MKVEPISNGNLRIWLSAEEWQKQGADGQALRQLLRAAARPLARLGKRLTAELIPVAGGWVLLLSARHAAHGAALVYTIDTLDGLYQLAQGWIALSHGQRVHNSLYEIADGYAVVVYPTPRLSREQAALLRTYDAQPQRGALAVAAVAEYGHLLAAGDALTQLITGHELPPQEPADQEN